ncbi:MAG: S8 family serine peptidase, partial [Proteobacteria bacterium]|nr:S8 family serine peptidase [Pseudomonadota bacterium]
PGAKEIDNTGIWDTPYEIDEDKDNYPLVDRSENYIEKIDKKPDLIIEDILYTPEEPTLQETIGFYVDVKNQGQSACKSFNVKFILGDSGDLGDFFGITERVDGLSPGASETVAFFYDPGEEKSEISKLIATISVDSSQEISESREDNNEKSITIEIKSAVFIEIEISKYYIKEDCDPSWPGVADPYFLIDVEGIDGTFRSPKEGNEPSVDQVGKGYPGPIYIPDSPVSLPAVITIKANDSDFDPIVPDYELDTYTFEISSLPQANSFDNGENIYFDVMVREVPATPLDMTTGGTNDPEISKQWYWYQVGASQVWQDEHYRNKLTSEESEIIVAVLDTGVDYTHPDLDENIWQNSGEKGLDAQARDKRSNGIDDDNNGFVDDWNGFDFVFGVYYPDIWIQDENGPMDEGGHGTKVAGIIAAEINNGVGIAGIAPNVKIMPVKVLPSSIWEEIREFRQWKKVDPTIDGIYYAVDQGADVITISLGGFASITLDLFDPFWQSRFEEALDYASERGVVVIAAAGNEKTSRAEYPAAFDRVISVSALARYQISGNDLSLVSANHWAVNPPILSYLAFIDEIDSGGSNYGPSLTNTHGSIEFSAPGFSVYSTDLTSRYPPYGGTGEWGTSLSCPVVSAIAAMVRGYAKSECDTELTPDDVRNILSESATDLGAPGWDPYYGYGMVNAYHALQKVDEYMPPICVKGGNENYQPLKVFFRGSQIHVNILKPLPPGVFTYTLMRRQPPEDEEIARETPASYDFDMDMPSDAPIGEYYIKIEGTEIQSEEFYIVFNPNTTGLSEEELENYWHSEYTGIKFFPRKYKTTKTSHYNYEVFRYALEAAWGTASPDEASIALAVNLYYSLNFIPSEPPSDMRDLIYAINQGEKPDADCDGSAYALVALSRAIGIPSRSILGTPHPFDALKGEPSHEWAENLYSYKEEINWQVWDVTLVPTGFWDTYYASYLVENNLWPRFEIKDEVGMDRRKDYVPATEWILGSLSSPANLHAYDSLGNHVGVNTKGEIDLQIPNSYYTGPDYELEEIIIFGQSENIKFRVEALEEGKFNLTITQSTEEETKKITYKDVPIAETTEATIDVSEANPTYIMEIDDDGDGTTDRKREPESIDVIGQDSYSLQLCTGWNLISLPLTPEDTNILNVMSSVADNWNSVWSYEGGIWKRYDLTGPDFLNTLTFMEPGRGYWLHMKSDDTLSISGSEPRVKSIPLTAGWNLVGYNSLNSMPTTEAMSSLAGNWNSVWSYEGGNW